MPCVSSHTGARSRLPRRALTGSTPSTRSEMIDPQPSGIGSNEAMSACAVMQHRQALTTISPSTPTSAPHSSSPPPDCHGSTMDPKSKRADSLSGIDRLRPVPAQPLPQQMSSYPTGLRDSPFGAISRTFNQSPTLVGSLQGTVGARTSPTSYSALGQGHHPPTFSFQPDLQQGPMHPSSHLDDRHSVIGLVGGGEGEESEEYYDSWAPDSAVAGDEGVEAGATRPGTQRRAASLDTLSGASTPPSAEASSRSSRVAAEQRRRNDLQDSFRRLNEILPASSDRPSKKVILERAITTITDLRQDNETLARKLASYEAPSQTGSFATSDLGESASVEPVRSAQPRPASSHPFQDLNVVPSFGSTSSYPTPSDSSFPRFSFHPAPLPREHEGGSDG